MIVSEKGKGQLYPYQLYPASGTATNAEKPGRVFTAAGFNSFRSLPLEIWPPDRV